jgi:transketolase C-terminal domain/subunit
MASLFRQVGIYAPLGQLYQPEDSGSILSYREDKSGQILEEGITEAGALSSWTAAATSYSTHGLAMLPFYIYYSMFGFQRVGDLIWAAADQRARGFLIGATAGRTTLSGEGPAAPGRHEPPRRRDRCPNCKAYDPATAGELAVIVDRGMREMLEEQNDVFYYVTAMNESVAQPSLPLAAHDGVLRGLYRFRAGGHDGVRRVQLLASGAMLGEAIKAAEVLEAAHGVAADVWSVTSFSELARNGIAAERHGGHGSRRPRAQLRRRAARADARADRDRHRLRPRRARADPRLPAARPALRHARHRRLRPERHARRAAPPLRGRCRGDRPGGAALARLNLGATAPRPAAPLSSPLHGDDTKPAQHGTPITEELAMPVRLQRMSALTALALASGAASAAFDDFTPLPGSAPAGSLPEATPLQLSSSLFTQPRAAARLRRDRRRSAQGGRDPRALARRRRRRLERDELQRARA